MSPADETRYVNPFPGEADASTHREWDDPLVLVATATAEFMFLTDTITIDDRSVRHWKEPVRITTPHQEDVDSMLHQIARKIHEGIETIEDLEYEAILRLDEFLIRSFNHKEGALHLVRALPASLRELYMGPVFEAQRWIRLRRDGVLDRLQGLREATSDILEPSSKLIERWRDPLFKSLPHASDPGRAQGRSKPERLRERALRDARALASVTALNEAGLELGPEKGWRAILISGDEHLHSVYANQMWNANGMWLRPQDYVLRRPLQYTPVLNVADMSAEPTAVDVFNKLTEALDLTVAMLLDRSEEIRNPYWLEFHWERHGRTWLKGLDTHAIQDNLASCKGLWLETINIINARNYTYLTRDYRAMFEKLREKFDDPNAQEALRRYTLDVVEEIDGEHFRLVLEETIAELVNNAEPMRMPLLVRLEFPDLLGDRSLAEFLYSDPSRGTMARHQPAELESIAQVILTSPGTRSTLLTAILAAASGSFVRALRLTTRAVEFLSKDDQGLDASFKAELNCFHAVIARVNIESEHEYRRALGLLGKVAKDSKNPFEECRLHSERGALELQWYSVAGLGKTSGDASNTQKSSAMEAYASHLSEAHKHLSSARNRLSLPAGSQPDRLERELAQQISVNSAALNVYLKVAGRDPDLEMVDWALEQFVSLFNKTSPVDTDYLTKLWWLGAIWLKAPTRENRMSLRDHCKRTLETVRELPTGDRNDLESIQAYLARMPR